MVDCNFRYKYGEGSIVLGKYPAIKTDKTPPGGLVMDLTGWDYIAPAEGGVDIYARGKERVLIHHASGQVITKYLR